MHKLAWEPLRTTDPGHLFTEESLILTLSCGNSARIKGMPQKAHRGQAVGSASTGSRGKLPRTGKGGDAKETPDPTPGPSHQEKQLVVKQRMSLKRNSSISGHDCWVQREKSWSHSGRLWFSQCPNQPQGQKGQRSSLWAKLGSQVYYLYFPECRHFLESEKIFLNKISDF